MVVVVVDGVVAVLVTLGNFEVVLGNVEVTFGMEVDVVVSSHVFLVSSSLKLEFCTMCEKMGTYIELSLIIKVCIVLCHYFYKSSSYCRVDKLPKYHHNLEQSHRISLGSRET